MTASTPKRAEHEHTSISCPIIFVAIVTARQPAQRNAPRPSMRNLPDAAGLPACCPVAGVVPAGAPRPGLRPARDRSRILDKPAAGPCITKAALKSTADRNRWNSTWMAFVLNTCETFHSRITNRRHRSALFRHGHDGIPAIQLGWLRTKHRHQKLPIPIRYPYHTRLGSEYQAVEA